MAGFLQSLGWVLAAASVTAFVTLLVADAEGQRPRTRRTLRVLCGAFLMAALPILGFGYAMGSPDQSTALSSPSPSSPSPTAVPYGSATPDPPVVDEATVSLHAGESTYVLDGQVRVSVTNITVASDLRTVVFGAVLEVATHDQLNLNSVDATYVHVFGLQNRYEVSVELPDLSAALITISRFDLTLTLTCGGIQHTMHGGDRITLTYSVASPKSGFVGLGLGFYDNAGKDLSSGLDDIDSLQVGGAPAVAHRIFRVPGDSLPGRYELIGEVWPAYQVGAKGYDTLAEAHCPGHSFITVTG